MAIRLYQGKTKFMWLPLGASETHNAGSIVAWDVINGAGKLTGATAGTIPSECVGVLRHAVAATDDDYATASRLVEVEVPVEKNVVWECDVTTAAALTTTDMGEFHDLNTTGDKFVTGNSSIDIGYVVGYISATKGLYILNIGPECLGVAAD